MSVPHDDPVTTQVRSVTVCQKYQYNVDCVCLFVNSVDLSVTKAQSRTQSTSVPLAPWAAQTQRYRPLVSPDKLTSASPEASVLHLFSLICFQSRTKSCYSKIG